MPSKKPKPEEPFEVVVREPIKTVMCPACGRIRNGPMQDKGGYMEPALIAYMCTGDGCANQNCLWRVKK